MQKDIDKINKENKTSQKIISETFRNKYQQHLQHKLTKDKATTFEDLEQLIYDNAVEVGGRVQIKNTKLHIRKEIKEARKQKLTTEK